MTRTGPLRNDGVALVFPGRVENPEHTPISLPRTFQFS